MNEKLNAMVDDCVGANRSVIANKIQSAYSLGFLDGERSIFEEVKKSIAKLEEVLP